MGETTTATVMFTDLVGSTALRSRVGEERADVIRRAHDTALGSTVVEHGGVVVKGGGDGLLCTFASASDALSAAVAVQRAVRDLSRELGLDLQIRVGLSVGDVTIEDGDCFGMPVVEAARLEAAADAGQIICSDFVRVMARGRGDHQYRSLGTLSLKGIDEPVTAHEVPWEVAADPTPARTPFVGRSGQLAELRDALARAVRGDGTTVLVAAGAGMGKTRLLNEFVDDVDESTLVLFATCDEGESAPYAAVASAVERWADRSPSDAARVLGAQAPVMATIAPGLREIIADIDHPVPIAAELEQKRLLDSWERFVRHLAAEQPVVLVVDDLHWADQGTLALTRIAARTALRQPVLVVAAFRGDEVGDGHTARDTLLAVRREAAPTEVDLSGLTSDDVRALLTQLGEGSEVPEPFVDLLTTESAGNPLFIRETLLQLVADGRLRREGGQWVSDGIDSLALPDVLRHVFMRRVEHLSPSAVSLLSVASLFEAGFPLDTTARVADLDESAALDAIDEALAAQIIEPSDVFDVYRFAHALFRESLAASLSPSRRVRLHRRIAESIAEVVGDRPSIADAAMVARHFAASSEIPGADRGVDYALTYADGADAAASHLDALTGYRLARSLLPDDDERLPAVQRAIALSATLARISPDELLAEAALVVESTKPRLAAEFLVDLGRKRESEDVLTAWRLGDLARPLHSGEQDETWVSLRSWELAEQDWNNGDGGGFPLATPERRELMSVAARLRSDRVGIANSVPVDAAEAAAMAEWADPLHAGLIYTFQIGWLREAVEPLSVALDHALDIGDTGQALFACAALGRLYFCRGDQAEVDRLTELGAGLAGKLGDLSNPVIQYVGFVGTCHNVRHPNTINERNDMIQTLLGGLSPDLAWLRGLGVMDSVLAAHHDHGRSAAEVALSRALDTVAGASGGSPNLPLFLHSLATYCDGIGLTPDPRLAARLEHDVLAPGFYYLEADPLNSLGMTAGAAGDMPATIRWFASARESADRRGNRVGRAMLVRNEARAEFRNGFASGPGRFEELIAEGREHFAALVGFEPRIAELDELMTARDEGRPLPTW